MDPVKVADALRATVDPEQQSSAETRLNEMQKIISFCPILLDIIDSHDIELPVRQAGVIYLKNMVSTHWDESSPGSPKSAESGSSLLFTVHEQDRHVVREKILDVLIRAPDVIRAQLAVTIGHILKSDFPGRWPNIVEGIIRYLSNDATVAAQHASIGQRWSGALLMLYRLVKNYEYKKPEERGPLTESMKIILPIMYEKLQLMLPDNSAESVLIQKQILKIFFTMIQFSFQLDLMSQEDFQRWMECVRLIVARPVPPETLQIDDEERPMLVWWKCKKWAMHLLHRIFERYGNPGTVATDYTAFAEFYLKTCAAPVIETIFKILAEVRNGQYISPRVLHEALMYLSEGTGHAFSWKLMKSHMFDVIKELVFPLMCYSAKDQVLWDEDPQEFIRTKYDVFEEIINPIHAAITLLTSSMKRKDVLNKTVQFIVQIMNDANAAPQQKDGALHMVGSLSANLLKKKMYKTELESMLLNHVFPLADSPIGFLRARCCWCIREFSEVNYAQDPNLVRAMEVCVRLLLHDAELPVQMEAAMGLHCLVTDQPKASKMLEPQVKPVILKMLELIANTQNDDLCTVMQRFISDYMDHVIPIAVDIATRLSEIFIKMLNSEDDEGESKTLTIMGILNTLSSVLDVMEEHPQVMIHLEEIVRNIVMVVIDNSVLDYYEEILSLVYSLTCKQISAPMWQVFQSLCATMSEEAIDYFVDMMPAFHNYVTVDTPAFLSDVNRVKGVLAICQQVLTNDIGIGEEAECHAAKLFEVVIFQCKGQIDELIQPISEVVLARLTKEIKTSELRTMCLQVLIAALQYNPELFFSILQRLQPSDSNLSIIDHFLTQWLDDTDCFLGLHDRRVCILGLLSLIRMQPRPSSVANPELAKQILPSMILLFDGLQKAYEVKAIKDKLDVEDSDDEEDDSDADEIDEDALGSDDDEIDDDGKAYIEELIKAEKDSGNGNDDEYSEAGLLEETDLEIYETVLDKDDSGVDEFIEFKHILKVLELEDQEFCKVLTSALSPEQQEKIQKIFQLADQRKAAAESKMIEKVGGYQFAAPQVPQSFNFGGSSTFG